MKTIIFAMGMLLLFPAVALPEHLGGFGQDPLSGSRVFGVKGCSQCHAVNGVGGDIGPDLGRIARPRTLYDLATAMWNHIPEMVARMSELNMAPSPLSLRETGDLVAFLATLNYFDSPGNADRGKKVFGQKQCVVCHQVEHVGGVIGPSLDSVVHFGPIFIATAMWNHGPAMAEAMGARGIKRPIFKGAELRDLFSYLRSVSIAKGNEPVHVLYGHARDGEVLFIRYRCVDCHGVKGLGGPVGPALLGRGLYQNLIDFAAAMWNKAPAMIKEMKIRAVRVPKLRPREMADIIGYLYSAEYFGEVGSSRRGMAIVEAKRCLACHSLGGRGGKVGPNFEQIPDPDNPVSLIAAMWNHAGAMEKKMREQAVAWPKFKGDEMAHLMALLQDLGKKRP